LHARCLAVGAAHRRILAAKPNKGKAATDALNKGDATTAASALADLAKIGDTKSIAAALGAGMANGERRL
jgi:hypothetical protein